MLLRAVLLLACLFAAHAQAPRSPVLAAISPSAAAPLGELIGALDAEGKARVLANLDRLDQAALDPSQLGELSEAYRLLGRPGQALQAARTMSARDSSNPAGEVQSVLALAQAGSYASAQAAAESALKRFPGDKNLLAALHEVKGRAAPVTTRASAPRTPAVAATPGEADSRPAKLAVSVGKGLSGVPSPLTGDELRYVPGGAHKPTLLGKVWSGMLVTYALVNKKQDPQDVAYQARLRKVLDTSETGRAVVADLGGWGEIDKKIEIRMARLGSGTKGYSLAGSPDSKATLLISRELFDVPDAASASILAHELRHMSDYQNGDGKGLLAIPSELSAHRIQVRTFLELKAKMSAAEIEKASGYTWEYSKFIGELWKDHILSRYRTNIEFEKLFAHEEAAKMALQAYHDLDIGKVKPGSPHLDYHLSEPEKGMYSVLSDEKDILDLARDKKAKGTALTLEEKKLLVRRSAQMSRVDGEDRLYRQKHGFEVGEEK